MLGALLCLLIDHYVTPENKGILLQATTLSRQLQLEHMEDNSLAVQFVLHLEEHEPLGAEETLVGMNFDELVQRFQSWRLKVNDLTSYDKSTLINMFRPILLTERKSARVTGHQHPVKVRVITKIKLDMQYHLQMMKEGDENATTVVDDEPV